MLEFISQFKIKEILKFCVGGGSAVIVDFLLYIFLREYIPISTAKAISFIAGAIVGFVINKLWTFGSHRFDYREIIKYIILYGCSATINTMVNKGVLSLFNIVVLAFLVATGCSTIMNFMGQKFFVFREKKGDKK